MENNGLTWVSLERERILQTLQEAGYICLSPGELADMRGDDMTSVLLTPVLQKQLIEINSMEINAVREERFSSKGIEAGIRALQNASLQEDYDSGCRYVYELLTKGKRFEQNPDGGKVCHTLQYIDWIVAERNVYHVAENFMISRYGKVYVADLVLFVNGIPFCVIECKDEAIPGGIQAAVRQHIRQEADAVNLYVYVQLLITTSGAAMQYATNHAPGQEWSVWREKRTSGEEESWLASFRLCRPRRLLEFVYQFIFFRGNRKIAARYYQYDIVKNTLGYFRRQQDFKKRWGTIYQVAGSGKSLTIGWLIRMIFRDLNVRSPRIILITDRISEGNQLTGLLAQIGIPARYAATARELTGLMEHANEEVIVATYQKFQTAVLINRKTRFRPDIYLLLNEIRSIPYEACQTLIEQYLPDASVIAMTGMGRSDEDPPARWGPVIYAYTRREAVEEEVILPVLYQNRRIGKAGDAEANVYTTAQDICCHYEQNYKNTPYKGLLICGSPEETTAYKREIERIGKVSCELLTADTKRRDEEEAILYRFKNQTYPELLIVADLWTGVDISCVTVVYQTCKITEWTALQALGRVNRHYDDKKYGLWLDYSGERIFRELNEVNDRKEKVEKGVVMDRKTVSHLLALTSAGLRSFFQDSFTGEGETEPGDQFREARKRQQFYRKVKVYLEYMQMLVAIEGGKASWRNSEMKKYVDDLSGLIHFRNKLQNRFSEWMADEDYETVLEQLIQMQLLPDNLRTSPCRTEITDTRAFFQEIKEAGDDLAKADLIACRTKKYMTDHEENDEIFYQDIAGKIEKAQTHYALSGDSATYLVQVWKLMEAVRDHTEPVVPAEFRHIPLLQKYYKAVARLLVRKTNESRLNDLAREAVWEMDRIISRHTRDEGLVIVDWPDKPTLVRRIKLEWDDYFTDEIKEKIDGSCTYEEIETVADRCVEAAALAEV